MTIYGRKITDDDMENIGSYMNDTIREELHAKIGGCAEEVLSFTEETFCGWSDEEQTKGYENIASYINDYAHGLNESRGWNLSDDELEQVISRAIDLYNEQNGEKEPDYYYWLDTEYLFGDFNVKKWALYRGCRTEDGEKNRDTEEVVVWGEIPDTEDTDEAWSRIDEAITAKLGFLPDYEVN